MGKKISWVSDDITFCASKCNHKSCFRHPSNIHYPWLPHSFAEFKDTVYCEKTKEKEELKETF